MREDIKKYSDAAYEMINDISENIGSRLPGSEEEAQLASQLEDKIKDIGLTPKKERFIVAPRASIGGIPYIGWAGIIACLMLYFEQIAPLAFAICLACWIFLVVQVVLYKGWFDFLFHQEISHNVYTELLPEDGKYDYTIMLSAHMDTSWNWKHSAKNPNTMVFKMVYGVIAMLTVTACSLTMTILSLLVRYDANWLATQMPTDIANIENFFFAMRFVPIACIPGLFFVTMWCDKNKKTASPGAMDNLSGISINYQILKYFKENPDKMPKNCRIIDGNLGSEEAGLKGSIAFIEAHKGEEILENLYNINVDSIADKDYFQVIRGDAWQLTNFDKELEGFFIDAMKEAGIEKPGDIKNPVGGCDSTPFCKAGIKTITFAAQNPIATNYYHTYRDVASRFDADTVHTGMEVILNVIDKIADKENAKKD